MAAAFLVATIVLWSASVACGAGVMFIPVVLLAVGSAFAGWATATPVRPVLVGRFEQATRCCRASSLFFPATGIMVGVGMSGTSRTRAGIREDHGGVGRSVRGLRARRRVVRDGGHARRLLSNKLLMVNRRSSGPWCCSGSCRAR
ncbi:MAG: hypothetical protein R3F59_17815 [Myxococcota bacterium]